MGWPASFLASTIVLCFTLILLVIISRGTKDKTDKKETPIDDRTVTFPRLAEYTHPDADRGPEPGSPLGPHSRRR